MMSIHEADESRIQSKLMVTKMPSCDPIFPLPVELEAVKTITIDLILFLTPPSIPINAHKAQN